MKAKKCLKLGFKRSTAVLGSRECSVSTREMVSGKPTVPAESRRLKRRSMHSEKVFSAQGQGVTFRREIAWKKISHAVIIGCFGKFA